MSDRELLDLAAKAIGRQIARIDGDHRSMAGVFFINHGPDDYSWNPRTNDGDALRLAVKLGFFIDIDLVRHKVGIVWRNRDLYTVAWTSEDGQYASTREAITCAAAEIGKNMGT